MTKLAVICSALLWLSCHTEKKRFVSKPHEGHLVTINSKRIYYEEYGQGTPLLLLSGGGIDRSINDFAKCIPEFSKQFRVIAPDTPGQGRSEQADSLTYDVMTEFMSQLIDSLDLDTTYVMGWSDGGIVGILLAAKRPDKIKKLISVAPNNGLRAVLPPNYPVASVKPTPLELWEKRNKKSIERYENILPRDWRKLVTDLNAMWYQQEYFPKEVYGQIKIPVMIVLGDRDDIRTEHCLEMYRLINGSQFCVLPNTTHEVFNDRPDLINKIAIDFFKQ